MEPRSPQSGRPDCPHFWQPSALPVAFPPTDVRVAVCFAIIALHAKPWASSTLTTATTLRPTPPATSTLSARNTIHPADVKSQAVSKIVALLLNERYLHDASPKDFRVFLVNARAATDESRASCKSVWSRAGGERFSAKAGSLCEAGCASGCLILEESVVILSNGTKSSSSLF